MSLQRADSCVSKISELWYRSPLDVMRHDSRRIGRIGHDRRRANDLWQFNLRLPATKVAAPFSVQRRVEVLLRSRGELILVSAGDGGSPGSRHLVSRLPARGSDGVGHLMV